MKLYLYISYSLCYCSLPLCTYCEHVSYPCSCFQSSYTYPGAVACISVIVLHSQMAADVVLCSSPPPTFFSCGLKARMSLYDQSLKSSAYAVRDAVIQRRYVWFELANAHHFLMSSSYIILPSLAYAASLYYSSQGTGCTFILSTAKHCICCFVVFKISYAQVCYCSLRKYMSNSKALQVFEAESVLLHEAADKGLVSMLHAARLSTAGLQLITALTTGRRVVTVSTAICRQAWCDDNMQHFWTMRCWVCRIRFWAL